ncbi:MAG: OmpA family protein, partial [Candidatus Cloacimonadota bacterium]
DPDNDKDGILDVDDKCPNDPEDVDNFEDEDGCPDPDNDQDGILDVDDACPDDPETINDYEDEDGCPDTVPEVIFKKEAPIVLEGVNFEFNSAELTAGAKEVLMKVVRTLKDYPEMTLLIKGHTDNIGSDAYNLKLSQRRADSVRQFLIDNGIDPSRLESVGYGETQPIATNDTPEGRAKNRRIEFYRVK